MFSYEELEIFGFKKKTIPNTFFKQKEKSGKLAIVFPGLGYTNKMPLMYYTIRAILKCGYSVFSVDQNYSKIPEFTSADSEERERWLLEDAKATYEAVKQTGDKIEVLVGKSLGTIVLSLLLEEYPETSKSKMIWHTPLIKYVEVVERIKKHKPSSLFVIGSADPHYDPEILDSLVESTKGVAFVACDATHGMEIPGRVKESIWFLEDIIGAVEEFLTE